MINEKRLVDNFIKLTSFDSESFREKQIGEALRHELEELGLEIRIDTTEPNYLEAHPER